MAWRTPIAASALPASLGAAPRCAVSNRSGRPAARSGARRALAPTLAELAPRLLGALLLVPLAGCSDDGPEPGTRAAPAAAVERSAHEPARAPGSPEEAIEALVRVMQPVDRTQTSDILDAHFLAQRDQISRLRHAEPAVGREALRVLREEGSEVVELEIALLDVAAHAAPDDTRPLLVSLIDQYGASLVLRAEAAPLLAETSPETAIEVIEPWLRKTRPGQTMPPMEFLVRGWVIACDATGTDPVEVLALVATNIFMEESARHLAVRELGKHSSPLATKTLQAILIESSGNAYMRRLAVQGLVRTLSREELCTLLTTVGSREVDLNFAQFLGDVLDSNCADGTPDEPEAGSLAPR